MLKTYSLLNFQTKRSADVRAASYEDALEQFCGCKPPARPAYTARGLRMYHIGGQTVGIGINHPKRR